MKTFPSNCIASFPVISISLVGEDSSPKRKEKMHNCKRSKWDNLFIGVIGLRFCE